MYQAYILIGSNEGNRMQFLTKAKEQILAGGNKILECSAVYETASWGREEFPPHLNQILHLQTKQKPSGLLAEMQQIESDLGRTRQEKWGLRKIDIDIIYFEDYIIRSPQLQIPHPLIQQRRFVLTPLAEIAPDFLHPVLLKTNRELLHDIDDPLAVNHFTD